MQKNSKSTQRNSKRFLWMFCILALTAWPSTAAGAQTIRTIILKQQLAGQGPVEMHYYSGAAVGTIRSLRVYINSNTATVYNAAGKNYCQLSSQGWADRLGSGSARQAAPQVRTEKGNVMFLGYKCTRSWVPVYGSKGTLDYTYQVLSTQDMNVPAALVNPYLGILGLPKGLGVPLKIVRHAQGKMQPYLDTHSVSFANEQPSIFQPPSGYTRAKDELDVLLGSDDDLSALLGSNGAGVAGRQSGGHYRQPGR